MFNGDISNSNNSNVSQLNSIFQAQSNMNFNNIQNIPQTNISYQSQPLQSSAPMQSWNYQEYLKSLNPQTLNSYQNQLFNSQALNNYQNQPLNSQALNNYQSQPLNSQALNNYQNQSLNSQALNNYQNQPLNPQTLNNYQNQPLENQEQTQDSNNLQQTTQTVPNQNTSTTQTTKVDWNHMLEEILAMKNMILQFQKELDISDVLQAVYNQEDNINLSSETSQSFTSLATMPTSIMKLNNNNNNNENQPRHDYSTSENINFMKRAYGLS